MRIRPWIVDGLLILSLVAVASGIYRLNLTLESPRAAVGQPGEIGALPDGRVLRVLALGFERLVADLFWLRTVAYIGDDNVAAAGYPSAGALAELVTDIDPGFTSVYVLMNTLLESLCGEPDAAIALLDKGVGDYADFSWAGAQGMGVTDLDASSKASQHVRRLADALLCDDTWSA